MKRLRLFAATLATTSTAIAILLAWQISANAQKPDESSKLVNPLDPNVGPPITSAPRRAGMMGGLGAMPEKPNKPQELKVLTIANAPATDLSNSIRLVFQSATIAAEPVSNSIIIRGEPEELKAIEALALKLDEAAKARASTTIPPQTLTYPLDPEQANSVLAKLRSLFAESPELSLAFDPSNNQLVALAPPNQQAIIKAMLDFGQVAANQTQSTESNPNERNIIAQIDGTVTEVLVKHGDEVKAGQELVKLKNPELETRVKQYASDITAATETLANLEKIFQAAKGTYENIPAAKAKLESLKLQAELDQQKLQLLTIKSPIDGKVVTENLREKLIERPVAKGEALLSLALPSNEATARPVDSFPGLTHREVRSNTEGIVKEVLVKYGDHVKAGQPLLQLQDPKLDTVMRRLEREIELSKDLIQRTEKLQDSDAIAKDHPQRKANLEWLQGSKDQLAEYVARYKRYEENNKSVIVSSPIDGIVATRDVREQLINQPVKYGDPLLVLAVESKDRLSTSIPALPHAGTPRAATANWTASAVKPQNMAYHLAEQFTLETATKYRKLTEAPQSPTEDQRKKIEALKATLRDAVEATFNERQKMQAGELYGLRQRLNQIEATISTREKNREAIINRRVEELINPDVKWDASSATSPQSPSPPTRGAASQSPTQRKRVERFPVTTAREVDTPDGKKTVYETLEAEVVEDIIPGAPIKSAPELPADKSFPGAAPTPGTPASYPQPQLNVPPAYLPSDEEAILGDWQVESGVELTPEADRPNRCVITKDFIILSKDGEPTLTSNYKIDPTKTPKWFDIREKSQRLTKGIYKLQGNLLTLCFPKPDPAGGDALERPATFAENADSSNSILIKLKYLPRAAEPPAPPPAVDPMSPPHEINSLQNHTS